MQHVASGVSAYAQLTIVGPRGCTQHCPAGSTVYESSSRLLPFLFFSIWHAAKACRNTKFQIMIGGSGLVAPALLVLARIFGGRTVVFLHGLDIVVESRVYQWLFLPCIRAMDHLIANSRNTMRLATGKGIEASRLCVINPGTSLPDLDGIEPRGDFLRRKQVAFEKVMVFVGRITRRKGLSQFIRHSLPLIHEMAPTAGLVVVGENPDQSLNKQGEAKVVTDLVAELGLGDRVVFLGQLSDMELLAGYAAADVQIFPLIDVPGDVEGFGMVAIEAAACGTPTVAFAAGGVADAISEQNGILVEPGRYDLLAEAIVRSLQEGLPDRRQCVEHAREFRWENYHEKIRAVLESLL